MREVDGIVRRAFRLLVSRMANDVQNDRSRENAGKVRFPLKSSRCVCGPGEKEHGSGISVLIVILVFALLGIRFAERERRQRQGLAETFGL